MMILFDIYELLISTPYDVSVSLYSLLGFW